MTERAYVTVDRGKVPRLIQVADPGAGGSDEIIVQDLHDTLNSNTLEAGDPDLDNLDDDPLIDSAGKANLGGALETGITATLQNAQLAFQGNYTPAELGTATSADTNGETLTDTAAQFLTNGVARGAVILNWDDRSAAEVLEVVSEIAIKHRTLQGGASNDWEIGDAYSVYNVIKKLVSDGNLVAVDDIGDPLDAIFPTFCTQVIVALDTSAAAIATGGLTPSQQQIRDAMMLNRSAGTPGSTSVDKLLDDNPANVVTALANEEYDGVKYSDILQDLLAMAAGDIIEDPAGTFTVYERDGLTPRYVFKKIDNKRLRQ
jgi:hypothetical protein